jgi:dienelactone hydrolase
VLRARWIRLTGLALGLVAAGAAPASAAPLGLDDCGPTDGLYQCSGLVETWDGVPLDATVTLPAKSSRRLPLVALIHGFGNSKYEYLDPASQAYTGNAFRWARRGYAVLTYTARGLWGSCGTPDARLANALACLDGYIHLADVRYEGRDTQELIGRLVDQGYAHPRRIGVTGDSYGGGQSLMLGALRDRVVLPDGAVVPWRTDDGRRLSLAASAPVIPWSDLITAAAPNGRVSATGVTGRRRATDPVGVVKTTFVNAIFAAAQFATGPGQPVGEPFIPGRPMGFLAPPLVDPEADVASWVARTDVGEPYTDEAARDIVATLADHHSAYYLPANRPPAPLLLSSGFTDDLFPVDEVLRFANRTRARFPGSPLSLLLGDFGHQRAANKPVERQHLLRAIRRWFAEHLLGKGRAPRGATAYVQTCPRAAPPQGPHKAGSFAGLSRKVRRRRFPGPDAIPSHGGDPQVGIAIDPVTGGGDACVETQRSEAAGTARYLLKGEGRRPFTLLGAPRLRATLDLGGADPGVPQLAARLWDVAPGGARQRLVARGTYRPRDGRNAWQLHPGSWRFARGHAAELELLGRDPPYARPSNGTFEIEVRRLRVALPVR